MKLETETKLRWKERQHDRKIMREIARVIRNAELEDQKTILKYGVSSKKNLYSAWQVLIAGVLAAIIVFSFITTARAEQDFTDEQIVNAIRKAEGTWTYGIKTIKCATEKECRQICKNTVRNNRGRFRKNSLGYKDFIQYLGNRYCPTRGNLSAAEKRLNGNWVRNVKYFLAKNKEGR